MESEDCVLFVFAFPAPFMGPGKKHMLMLLSYTCFVHKSAFLSTYWNAAGLPVVVFLGSSQAKSLMSILMQTQFSKERQKKNPPQQPTTLAC